MHPHHHPERMQNVRVTCFVQLAFMDDCGYCDCVVQCSMRFHKLFGFPPLTLDQLALQLSYWLRPVSFPIEKLQSEKIFFIVVTRWLIVNKATVIEFLSCKDGKFDLF